MQCKSIDWHDAKQQKMDNIEATLGFRTYTGFAWDLHMCLKAIEKFCRSDFPQNSRKLGSPSSPAMAAATNPPVRLQIRDYCCMMSCCRAYGYCSRHAECSYVLYYKRTPYVTNGDLSTLQISEIAAIVAGKVFAGCCIPQKRHVVADTAQAVLVRVLGIFTAIPALNRVTATLQASSEISPLPSASITLQNISG